jgi:glyoxylase-like metal-dependent hydrolase (beta-lactamase superfamily II)
VQIEALFDARTWTLTYVVWDPQTHDAVIIDPVLDYDPLGVRVFEESLDALVTFVRTRELKVHLVLDTHAHADHLSGFQRLKTEFGARIGIGAKIGAVQQTFRPLFGLPPSFPTDGSQWDVLAKEGEPLRAGSLTVEPIATPGHTPACVTYKIGDALFTGDTLFMPDYGTGRCDFPGGSAEALFDSIQRLYALPDETRVFVGHDYQPGGRPVRWETTIGESKRSNVQLPATIAKEAFVRFRKDRDSTLRPPNLLFQSLQVNVNAGRLPEPDANGFRHLRLPLEVNGRRAG